MRTPILPPRCFLYGRNAHVEVFWTRFFESRRTIMFYGRPIVLLIPDHVFVVSKNRATGMCELYVYAGQSEGNLRVSPLPNVYTDYGRACTVSHKSPRKIIDGFLSGDFNLEVHKYDVWEKVGLSGIEHWVEKTQQQVPINWSLLPNVAPSPFYTWPEGARWARCPMYSRPSMMWVHSNGCAYVIPDSDGNVDIDVHNIHSSGRYVTLELVSGRCGWGALARIKPSFPTFNHSRRQRTVWEWTKRAVEGKI